MTTTEQCIGTGALKQAQDELLATRRKLRAAEELVAQLEQAVRDKITLTHDACVAEFGQHVDDGGMFFATCARCGYADSW